MTTKDSNKPHAPRVITAKDYLAGCQCDNFYLAGKIETVRCVTCPIHGDAEFKKAEATK